MNTRSRILYLVLPLLLLLSACHRTPDHVKYIPKNALMVAEINTKELSKKIAWELITNSNLWDKLRGKASKEDSAKQSEFIKNMKEAGVDELNSFYAYLKNNGANDKEACFVALIPLKDATKWESFVKKSFAGASIKENKTRKEAKLTDDIYAGWTSNLLIVVSVQSNQNNYNLSMDDAPAAPAVDKEVLMASHLESAFNVSKENALMSDARFAAFQKNKHDLGFWVNIEEVMNSYGSKNLGMMTGGLSFANTMWKNAAFSATTNFEKGKIVTDMLMYSSNEMKDINKQFGNEKIDNDVVSRIPNAGLDYVLAYHLSPQGTQKMIEKMGMLGLMNGYLKEQNLSVEEIMDAISGDMVFSMNNYTQTKETLLFDSTDASSTYSTYKTDLDMLLALKVKKVATFKKILSLAVSMQMLEQVSEGVYKIKAAEGSKDQPIIVLNDQFAVFSNKPNIAQNYVQGTYTKQTPPAVKDYIYNHPFAMYFDYNNWAKRMNSSLASNAADSMVYTASLKTFDNFVFNGGNYNDNTFKYQMNINFVNKSESSLLQLIDFGKVLQEAQAKREAEAQSNYFPHAADSLVQ